jgi:predicted signal transduction protein with EAL and GGDEF domain
MPSMSPTPSSACRSCWPQPLTIADTSLAMSASIGIAMFPADGRDMETLVHRADMAMYQAKSRAAAASASSAAK